MCFPGEFAPRVRFGSENLLIYLVKAQYSLEFPDARAHRHPPTRPEPGELDPRRVGLEDDLDPHDDISPAETFSSIGSREEIQQLTSKQYAGLYRLVQGVVAQRLYTRDDLVVTEIVHDTWEKLSRFYDPQKAPAGAIAPITVLWARQACTRYLKRQEDHAAIEYDISGPDTVMQDVISEENERLKEEYLDKLYKNIAKLRPQDQRVLMLKFADLSYGEIAQELGISRDTLKMRLYRARVRLHKLNKAQGLSDLQLD